jgi:hypothetical protein
VEGAFFTIFLFLLEFFLTETPKEDEEDFCPRTLREVNKPSLHTTTPSFNFVLLREIKTEKNLLDE